MASLPKHTTFTSLNDFHFKGMVIKRRRKEIPRHVCKLDYNSKNKTFLIAAVFELEHGALP